MSFDADLERDFLRITAQTIFCTMTTVDSAGRPRGRVLHPIFVVRDGRPRGWALTSRTPLKARHLAANPHVSCSFWTPSHDTVFVDAVATWVEDERERRETWELFLDTPAPLGWGADGMAGYGPLKWNGPSYSALRLEPWRVQVMRGEAFAAGDMTGRVWHA